MKEDTIHEATPLKVALPRNLLNGFCKIKPLMNVGKRLKEEGLFPGDGRLHSGHRLDRKACVQKQVAAFRERQKELPTL